MVSYLIIVRLSQQLLDSISHRKRVPQIFSSQIMIKRSHLIRNNCFRMHILTKILENKWSLHWLRGDKLIVIVKVEQNSTSNTLISINHNNKNNRFISAKVSAILVSMGKVSVEPKQVQFKKPNQIYTYPYFYAFYIHIYLFFFKFLY